MSNTILRLPNERPGSVRPGTEDDQSVHELVVRDGDEVSVNIEYYPRHDEWCRANDGRWLSAPDGWCYRHEYDAAFQHHVSRGFILPPGWLPIDELTVETMDEFDMSNIALCSRRGYVNMMDTWLDRLSNTDITYEELLARVLNCPTWVGYQIVEPLERVEG